MEDGDGGTAANPPSKAMDTGTGDGVVTARCTVSNCRKEMDKNMIGCKPCGKYTHYACTRLPPSQLQRFMTKGHIKYICENCYAKDYQVHEDYINNSFERECTTRESELLKEIEQLKRCADQAIEENITVKEELEEARKGNKDLVIRIKSLEEGDKQTESAMRTQGILITSLREKLAAKSTEPNEDLSTENERLLAQIAEMKEELAAFKQSVQNYEANEAALKDKVLVSEENLKKQQQTFAEAGNPDYDNIAKLEECMRKELVQIGKKSKIPWRRKYKTITR